MIAPRHLPNAPIKEALIDFHVTLPEKANFEIFDACHKGIIKEYPVKKTLHQDTVGLEVNEDRPIKTTVDRLAIGYRYESADSRRVAQFRTNGFTFSWLEPYTTWEEMRDEAQELWSFYVQIASPEIITRVATRFVNVMRIPLPIKSFGDYLTAPPQIPDTLPQEISSFLTRIIMPAPSVGATAIITQALENIENDFAPVVLDIDVFAKGQFEIATDQYWICLDELRILKNTIFFESITEQTAELFK